MQLHKGFTHWLYQHHEHNTVKSKEKKRKTVTDVHKEIQVLILLYKHNIFCHKKKKKINQSINLRCSGNCNHSQFTNAYMAMKESKILHIMFN